MISIKELFVRTEMLFGEEAMKKYEQSILSEFEIKSVKKDISKENEGIRAKLTYTLYGEIGEQVDIYLNK